MTERRIYRTWSDEAGRMFVTKPEWRRQKPVTEEDVQYFRDTLASGEATQAERDRAEQWLREYEEVTRDPEER